MDTPSFLLIASTPKEQEMLRQALLQKWPKAIIQLHSQSLSSPPTLILVWKDAYQNVLPEVLNHKNVLIIFETAEAATRTDIFKFDFNEVVLPTESRSAFLCMTCERLINQIETQKEQKQKWDKVVKNSTDAIYLITNGQLVDVNPRFETLFGYNREEALSPEFSILNHIVAPESRTFIANRLKRIKRDQKVDTQYEFVATQKDGTTFFAEVSIRYVDDRQGKSALGIVKDITEQKEFETKLVQKNNELLRLSERQQRTLRQLNAIDEFARTIVTYRDKAPLIEHVARQIRKLFSPDRFLLGFFDAQENTFQVQFALEGEVTQHSISPISRDHTLMGTAMELQRALQRHLPTSATLTAPPLPNLEASWTQEGMQSFIAIPILKRRAPIGGVLMAFGQHTLLSDNDLEALMSLSNHLALGISNVELYHDKKEAEQKLQETLSQQGRAAHLIQAGEIAAGVAHDMNNLFSAALGRTTLIRKSNTPQEVLGHVDIIDKTIGDGIQTLKRLQGFSPDTVSSDLETVTPVQLINEVIAITRPKWSRLLEDGLQPQIEIIVEDHAQEGLEISILGHEIREVLINLFYNAVDAMPEGGKLKIAINPIKDGYLSIQIKDTGVGIAEDKIDKIFERFFTTKGVKGTGLGLATSKELIEKHNGSLTVDSKTDPENHGTAFTLQLPVQAAAPHSSKSLSSGSQRVLIVDDESNVREILEDILCTEGHQITTCASGEEALTIMQNQSFELVFTDLSLPQMDGYALTDTIKSQWPQTSVCLITGWDNPLVTEKGVQNKVDRMINKPFHMDEVLQAVRELT